MISTHDIYISRHDIYIYLLQNEMMVGAFAATMLATIPVLLGNEFDVNVGLKKKKRSVEEDEEMVGASRTVSSKYNRIIGRR